MSKMIFLTSALIGYVGLMTFLAMGGIVFIIPFLLIGFPLLALAKKKFPESHARSKWHSFPHSTKLELIAEKIPVPVLITHRDSTEIIFANSKAKEILGGPLVGRTAHSDEAFRFKPVKVNGLPISAENHPALQMKASATQKMRTLITWLTPTGERSLDCQIRSLFASPADAENFLLVKIHVNDRIRHYASAM